jgi:alkylated DNA nucleotide flippase Atl1
LTRKKWSEKLRNSKDLPRVEQISHGMSKRWDTSTVAIPTPIEVDQIMRQIPQGRLITIKEIRSALASKHSATIGCPLTTGIFAWIAANAAEEEREEGGSNITPYWRTLKSGEVLNPKYPGGVERQRKLLEREGHKIIQKGKNQVVVEYEKSLANPGNSPQNVNRLLQT